MRRGSDGKWLRAANRSHPIQTARLDEIVPTGATPSIAFEQVAVRRRWLRRAAISTSHVLADSKSNKTRSCKTNLMKFITDARSAKATSTLFSPVARKACLEDDQAGHARDPGFEGLRSGSLLHVVEAGETVGGFVRHERFRGCLQMSFDSIGIATAARATNVQFSARNANSAPLAKWAQ
jgi:hypothetical protein